MITKLSSMAPLLFIIALFLGAVHAQADDDGSLRPCGFKIAPCPRDSICSYSDPSCPETRGENCPGVCQARTLRTTTTSAFIPTRTRSTRTTRATTRSTRPTRTIRTTSAPEPTSTRHRYEDCGGKRIAPKDCPKGWMCVDDPYRVGGGGCGLACDAPGICVKPTACAGIAGRRCQDGKMCVDDPRDDCDVKRGGRDCGGICI